MLLSAGYAADFLFNDRIFLMCRARNRVPAAVRPKRRGELFFEELLTSFPFLSMESASIRKIFCKNATV